MPNCAAGCGSFPWTLTARPLLPRPPQMTPAFYLVGFVCFTKLVLLAMNLMVPVPAEVAERDRKLAADLESKVRRASTTGIGHMGQL